VLVDVIFDLGLRISKSPTSDKLSPQESTKPDAPDMGLDGAVLYCPGSSVVADARPDHLTVASSLSHRCQHCFLHPQRYSAHLSSYVAHDSRTACIRLA
jgi:hypothetical protein